MSMCLVPVFFFECLLFIFVTCPVAFCLLPLALWLCFRRARPVLVLVLASCLFPPAPLLLHYCAVFAAPICMD